MGESGGLVMRILESSLARRARLVLVGDPSLSYDMIIRAHDHDDLKFILKVREDVDSVDRETIVDLMILSKASNATPLLVGVKYGDEDMVEDVVYKKEGIFAAHPVTLKKLLDGGRVKFIKDRGFVKARVRGRLLRRLREEGGLSLGDLAEALGVSRRTIYEYERGSMEASERTATLLVEIFNEEILEDVDLRSPINELRSYMDRRSGLVDEDVRRLLPSYDTYTLEKAHARFTAISGGESYLVDKKDHVNRELMSIASVLGIGVALINPRKDEVEFIGSDAGVPG
jgi:putative transcriptional regulator